MEVILLERVEKLGQMGDTVQVRPGYARNFLLPQQKALRATKANKAYFERIRADLEARNLERRKEAEAAGEKLKGLELIMIRQAGRSGQLYGSVATKDISTALQERGVQVTRQQIELERPIKALGIYRVRVILHPEVSQTIAVNVAQSEDEARLQADRGGMVTSEILADEEARAEAEADSDEDLDEAAEAETEDAR